MTAPDPAPSQSSRPRIALVMGSGALRAMAALPLLRFLDEHGIRPDLLVGCSGGGVVLAGWVCGYSPEEMIAIGNSLNPAMFQTDWRSLAIMFGLKRRGFNSSLSIFKTKVIRQQFRTWFEGRRLESLPIPLILQATDFQTGEGVEMASGDLAEAIYASSAAYPFFHPIQREGRLLFDGVFSAPVPVLAAIRRGMDIVLAVDFAEDIQAQPRNLFEALGHIDKVMGRAVSQSQMLASIDLYPSEILRIKVRFKELVQFQDVGAAGRIQAAGEAAVVEFGPEILALCGGGQASTRSASSSVSRTGLPL